MTADSYAPQSERRSSRRVPLGLALHYSMLSRNAVLRAGSGRTKNVSGGGVLFDADAQLPVGTAVELSVAWPVLSDGIRPIELVVFGRVIRAENTEAAVRIDHYEFLPPRPRETSETGSALRPQLRKRVRNHGMLRTSRRRS